MSKFNFLSASIGLGSSSFAPVTPSSPPVSTDSEKKPIAQPIDEAEEDETTYQHYRKDPEDIPTIGGHEDDKHRDRREKRSRHSTSREAASRQLSCLKHKPKHYSKDTAKPKETRSSRESGNHDHKEQQTQQKTQWILQCYR